ncbi:MAG: histidine kinase [Burkholderiales bacterium]|nr:histidine kinase [Burkholderiales bacterium]
MLDSTEHFESPLPRTLPPMLSWRRILLAVILSTLIGLPISLNFVSPVWSVLARANLLGLSALLAFGLLERWPAQLPRGCARWALQVAGVAFVIPVTTYLIYAFRRYGDAQPFWMHAQSVGGFFTYTAVGMLIAPWVALAALIRQKEAWANAQALSFALERSELQRQASDARLHLLQAQVAPHFLFNTLANIQALVDAGSTQASGVLRNLIAYLRATVPRLHESSSTVAQELDLVRAYLELMYMRMPDRLQFDIQTYGAIAHLHCPPMTLLTVVENAVRHGIDPSERGGRIDIEVRREGNRCRIRVADTGVGLQGGTGGLGTGLAMLRERLKLRFQGDIHMSLEEQTPSGVCALLDFPAEETSTP